MVETYCQKTDVLIKAGTQVSSALTDAQYTTLINQAEATVNHIMGADLISTYSGLADSVKLILEAYCSSKAGNEAIAFDQSGYSNAAVTNLLNINATTIKNATERLKDKDVLAAIQDGY